MGRVSISLIHPRALIPTPIPKNDAYCKFHVAVIKSGTIGSNGGRRRNVKLSLFLIVRKGWNLK